MVKYWLKDVTGAWLNLAQVKYIFVERISDKKYNIVAYYDGQFDDEIIIDSFLTLEAAQDYLDKLFKNKNINF